MKKAPHLLATPGLEVLAEDPVLRPAFFVLVMLGEDFEDGSYPPLDEWSRLYQTVAGKVMTVLRKLGAAGEGTAKSGKCLILCIEARQGAEATHIGSPKSLESKLMPAISAVLREGKRIYRIPLLADDHDRGQLFGTVLQGKGIEEAVAFCKLATKGEERVPGKEINDEWESLSGVLSQVIAARPSSYTEQRKYLATLSDEVRNEIAKAIEPAINAEAAKRPQTTYEEKKELAKWINGELRRFGLALQVEGAERPCLMMGNQGGRPGFGRFMFFYTDNEGKRRDALTAVSLPPLHLTLDDMTRDSFGQKTSKQR